MITKLTKTLFKKKIIALVFHILFEFENTFKITLVNNFLVYSTILDNYPHEKLKPFNVIRLKSLPEQNYFIKKINSLITAYCKVYI